MIIERIGIEGGSVINAVLVYKDMNAHLRPSHFTKEYDFIYDQVRNLHAYNPFYVLNIFIDNHLSHPSNSGLVQLILSCLKNNMYIGCRFYANGDQNDAHLFMITGFSASKRAFYVKNTWGKFISLLYVNDIGKGTIVFDGEKIRARINLFEFVYTRKGPPFQFQHIGKEEFELLQREWGGKEVYTEKNPFTV